jgi:hypothetical protein
MGFNLGIKLTLLNVIIGEKFVNTSRLSRFC